MTATPGRPKEEWLRLISTRELARFLGVPVEAVYGWRANGEGPPAYRIGRHLRFRWPDIRRWMSSRENLD